ncbi:dihydrofolate reductase family protein [Planomonospora venezuelensis]|uniref:Dihydrofolate reductase n=1 Tax=Planomonospora venezuelensis TaxID=1999 RepID=A0A841D2V3_PLAVE|nr:dihydrofolate reductase family protein [Planomonospora venezuelensis]MBB5964571.1 dihydrofolate reductase [Planomonospora venezuelensis]GIN02868.1 pyrimidine reductase [Planomonospora venezuelensis]
MSKVVAIVFISMDGVVEEPAWTAPFWNEDHDKFQAGQIAQSRALLLGRVTYDGMSQAWPAMEAAGEEVGEMNDIPKYVASTTLKDPQWNATVLEGDVAEAVAKLKAEEGKDLLIYGSGSLIGYLIEHDLLDELKLFLHPVVVGKGRRLFRDGVDTTTWRLAGTHTFASGAIVLDYRPARPAQA